MVMVMMTMSMMIIITRFSYTGYGGGGIGRIGYVVQFDCQFEWQHRCRTSKGFCAEPTCRHNVPGSVITNPRATQSN